jgi:hypothetical protein
MYARLLAAATGLIVVLVGCAVNEGTYKSQYVPSGKYYQTGVYWDNFAITDKSIAKKIAVERQGSERTATGTLEVWASLRNRTDFPLQVECRVQFFNADSAPVEGPSAWRRLMLPANTIATWRELSMGNGNIAHYYGEIREGR